MFFTKICKVLCDGVYYICCNITSDKLLTIIIVNCIMLLTRSGAKRVNIVLLILTFAGVCLSGAALVIMIVKQYVGFNIYSNPISCSSNSYASQKYSQMNYLSSSISGQAISLLFSSLAFTILLVILIKMCGS
jgi:hypothetical protein